MRRWAPWLILAATAGCQKASFDSSQIAEGPGGMIGNNDPITSGVFAGGNDSIPAPRSVASPDPLLPPNCDSGCAAFCDGSGLTNPVNRGLCRVLWGVGLSGTPVHSTEACRRMFIDLVGRIPSLDEANAACQGDWGATTRALIADPAFVLTNQRRAADAFLYSTHVVNVSRIYDMDRLVAKTYQGRVPYDLFGSIAAVHPVVTRRYGSPTDIVDADYKLLLGRVAYDEERTDLSHLFVQWGNSYVDHPQLAIRMPDAFLTFPCVGPSGASDPVAAAGCTSVLWGYHRLLFTPDVRAGLDTHLRGLSMWSGLITADEWSSLAMPGTILTSNRAFWEKAVSDALMQYLGYDLSALVPQVRQNLVDYLLANNGDIRSLHFAVVTSAAYLMSHEGSPSSSYRWTMGPFKQVQPEIWLDGLARATNTPVASCDHRISDPDAMLASGSLGAYRLLQASKWKITDQGMVDHSYSDVARTLGGCPDNVIGGRFSVVSILTTVTQLDFVNRLCNPSIDPALQSAPIAELLPSGVDPSSQVDSTLGQSIATFQYRKLLGRDPTQTELDEASTAAATCAQASCSAEAFARPLCFAMLSSADALFY